MDKSIVWGCPSGQYSAKYEGFTGSAGPVSNVHTTYFLGTDFVAVLGAVLNDLDTLEGIEMKFSPNFSVKDRDLVSVIMGKARGPGSIRGAIEEVEALRRDPSYVPTPGVARETLGQANP